MGVDLATYRARIGTFNLKRNPATTSPNVWRVLYMLLCVAVGSILLIRSGDVKKNPGRKGKRNDAPILRDLVCIEVPPTKWFQMGLQLNIPKHQLDVIRANNPTNVNNCIMEMFSARLNGAAGGVTYAELEGALIRIGLSSLAARVVQSSEGPLPMTPATNPTVHHVQVTLRSHALQLVAGLVAIAALVVFRDFFMSSDAIFWNAGTICGLTLSLLAALVVFRDKFFMSSGPPPLQPSTNPTVHHVDVCCKMGVELATYRARIGMFHLTRNPAKTSPNVWRVLYMLLCVAVGSILLIRSGDVEKNPGPKGKHNEGPSQSVPPTIPPEHHEGPPPMTPATNPTVHHVEGPPQSSPPTKPGHHEGPPPLPPSTNPTVRHVEDHTNDAQDCFRSMIGNLQSQLNPDDISAHLYSAALLSKSEYGEVISVMLANYTRAAILLNAVERAIHIDPKNFSTFLDILDTIHKYRPITSQARAKLGLQPPTQHPSVGASVVTSVDPLRGNYDVKHNSIEVLCYYS